MQILLVFWLHKKEVGNMLSSLKKLRDADFATLSLPFHLSDWRTLLEHVFALLIPLHQIDRGQPN